MHKPQRALAPWELRRNDFLVESKARGQTLVIGTTGCAAAIQNDFFCLDPKEKARYESLSDPTVHRRFLPASSRASCENKVDILKRY